MIIDGFNKLTLLDYPETIACIIFTRGCNFKCSYCHNYSLIETNNEEGNFSEDEILDYLEKRKKVIKGIVISGGEPTIQKNLIDFIKKVKEKDYLVKLDTNGTNPKLLKELIDKKLIDYIAMDIKNSFNNYEKVICKKTNMNNIKESIKILKESKIDHEFRTTLIKEYIKLEDLKEITKITTPSKYYIQNFKLTDQVFNKKLHGYEQKEIQVMVDYLKKINKRVEIR